MWTSEKRAETSKGIGKEGRKSSQEEGEETKPDNNNNNREIQENEGEEAANDLKSEKTRERT